MEMKFSRQDYFDAVNKLVDVIIDKFEDKIVAIYAGGSFARGDFVPGRSDIDIYVVARENYKGQLQKSLDEEARKIETKYFDDLRCILDEVLGVSVTTLEEIQNGQSFLGSGFEYHNFIKTGRLLYGKDIKDHIPKPTREQEKKSAQRMLKKLSDFIKTQQEILLNIDKENPDKLTRQAFATIFRSASIALCGAGMYVSGKQEIVTFFKQKYPNKRELGEILQNAFRLWKKWEMTRLDIKELKHLLNWSMEFIKDLRSIQ